MHFLQSVKPCFKTVPKQSFFSLASSPFMSSQSPENCTRDRNHKRPSAVGHPKENDLIASSRWRSRSLSLHLRPHLSSVSKTIIPCQRPRGGLSYIILGAQMSNLKPSWCLFAKMSFYAGFSTLINGRELFFFVFKLQSLQMRTFTSGLWEKLHLYFFYSFPSFIE